MEQAFAYDTSSFKQTNNKSKHDAIGYEFKVRHPVVSKTEFNLWDTPSAYMMTSTERFGTLDKNSNLIHLINTNHEFNNHIKIYLSRIGEPMPMHMLRWFTNKR